MRTLRPGKRGLECKLLTDDRRANLVEAQAAVLFGYVNAQQSQFSRLEHEFPRHPVILGIDRFFPRQHFFAQEFLGGSSEHPLLLGDVLGSEDLLTGKVLCQGSSTPDRLYHPFLACHTFLLRSMFRSDALIKPTSELLSLEPHCRVAKEIRNSYLAERRRVNAHVQRGCRSHQRVRLLRVNLKIEYQAGVADARDSSIYLEYVVESRWRFELHCCPGEDSIDAALD